MAAAWKAAAVAPSAVIVSYLDARLVRASTGGLGWLFGTEFWLMVLVLAGLYIRRWTDEDDKWVSVFVLGTTLVAGLIAGPCSSGTVCSPLHSNGKTSAFSLTENLPWRR